MPAPTSRTTNERLSDLPGEYRLTAKCSACEHQREIEPQFLARIFG